MLRFRPVLALLLCFTALARQDQSTCGTHADILAEELQLHLRAATRSERRASAVTARGALLPDVGQIAILDDTDGVVARRNPFNLSERTLTFRRTAAGYRYAVGALSFDPEIGGELRNLQDDDTREEPLPFTFPFYGAAWTSVFINSDGNLTFGAGDPSITERSLGKTTAGPPRIAALFRDLDPARARNGIRVLSEPGRFVVSWIDVPEYQDFGTGPLQSFQIRLFPDGRIEFAYGRVTTRDAVVGIAPGRLSAATAVVSFLDSVSAEYPGAIVERFTSAEEIDLFAAAQKFYRNHEDSYDYLVVYNTLGIRAGSGVVAFQVPVRNNRSGYGDPKIDVGPIAGSGRRLQTILNMGQLAQYPADPFAVVPSRSVSGDTPLSVLGHEAGHLFLAYASVRDARNPNLRPMLGRDLFHWAFTFNSDASLVEGNRIADDGPGANPRFRTTAAVQGFSALDQYLMGLRSPSEVPPTFLIENSGASTSAEPEVGVAFNGTRRDITIEEIIAAEGRRVPDHTVSQRRYRFAFVLVTAAGVPPSPAQVAQVERYRSEFETYFSKVTDGRAEAETALKNTLYVSLFPAAGVIQGNAVGVQVSTDRLVDAPLNIAVRRRAGIVDVPSLLTIPAGAGSVRFTLTGIRTGVEELIFQPEDSRWETVEARVQVSPPSNLTLAPVPASRREILLRVSDINDLPYPNVPIRVVQDGGSYIAAETGADGIARVPVPPGSGAPVFSVDGGPAIAFSGRVP